MGDEREGEKGEEEAGRKREIEGVGKLVKYSGGEIFLGVEFAIVVVEAGL